MLDILTMYELYIKELTVKQDFIKNSLVDYTTKRTSLSNLLENNREIIDLYLNVKTDKIKEATSKDFIDTIMYPIMPVYTDGKEVNFAIIKLYIEKYIWINQVYTSYKKELSRVSKQIISFVTYKTIIDKFNYKISEEIVNENYLFEPLISFGQLYVIKNENHRFRVNWGASNKKKKQILAEGKIPYKEEDARDTPEYEGIEWLEYHPTTDYFLHWGKNYTTRRLNPWLGDYTYKPARGKNSIVTKLQTVKQDREVAKRLYTRTLN